MSVEERVKCNHCKQMVHPSQRYANRRCKNCHAVLMSEWYQKNRSGILKEHRVANAIRCAKKWVRNLAIEGECLVCGERDFHATDCTANALLAVLETMG